MELRSWEESTREVIRGGRSGWEAQVVRLLQPSLSLLAFAFSLREMRLTQQQRLALACMSMGDVARQPLLLLRE